MEFGPGVLRMKRGVVAYSFRKVLIMNHLELHQASYSIVNASAYCK